MVTVYSLAENISILVSFQAGIVGRIWWFIFKVLNIALQKDHRVSVVEDNSQTQAFSPGQL